MSSTTNSSELRDVIRQSYLNRRYYCEYCNFTSYDWNKTSRHWEMENRRHNIFYTCSFCDEKCYSKSKMICHLSSHARVDTNSRIQDWLSSLTYSKHEVTNSKKRKAINPKYEDGIDNPGPPVKRQRQEEYLALGAAARTIAAV